MYNVICSFAHPVVIYPHQMGDKRHNSSCLNAGPTQEHQRVFAIEKRVISRQARALPRDQPSSLTFYSRTISRRKLGDDLQQGLTLIRHIFPVRVEQGLEL